MRPLSLASTALMAGHPVTVMRKFGPTVLALDSTAVLDWLKSLEIPDEAYSRPLAVQRDGTKAAHTGAGRAFRRARPGVGLLGVRGLNRSTGAQTVAPLVRTLRAASVHRTSPHDRRPHPSAPTAPAGHRSAARARRGHLGCVLQIGSTCFHVPITWFREVFDNAVVWDRFISSFVGYVDEQPVSTTSIVSGAGVIGVYNVATLPGSRRLGFGEAVMRRALAEVHRERGVEPVILQSTPAGLRLYERMGFRTVARVAVYSS